MHCVYPNQSLARILRISQHTETVSDHEIILEILVSYHKVLFSNNNMLIPFRSMILSNDNMDKFSLKTLLKPQSLDDRVTQMLLEYNIKPSMLSEKRALVRQLIFNKFFLHW